MILLRTEFSETKMEEGGDVVEHIGRLERCQRLLKDSNAPIMDFDGQSTGKLEILPGCYPGKSVPLKEVRGFPTGSN